MINFHFTWHKRRHYHSKRSIRMNHMQMYRLCEAAADACRNSMCCAVGLFVRQHSVLWRSDELVTMVFPMHFLAWIQQISLHPIGMAYLMSTNYMFSVHIMFSTRFTSDKNEKLMVPTTYALDHVILPTNFLLHQDYKQLDPMCHRTKWCDDQAYRFLHPVTNRACD